MFTLGSAIVCASLIVPPIVSGATPTLEAVIWRFSRTSRGELMLQALLEMLRASGIARRLC
jgi:hypothetical protein